jgi:hypothetical protein
MAENNPLTDREIVHCRDCKWYDGRCHRYPPKIFKYGDAKRPIVDENDFCGEGVLIEKKAKITAEDVKTVFGKGN